MKYDVLLQHRLKVEAPSLKEAKEYINGHKPYVWVESLTSNNSIQSTDDTKILMIKAIKGGK